MSWNSIRKKPTPFQAILMNMHHPDQAGGYYCLGWHDGLTFCNAENKVVQPTDWHKLPDPPIKGNKILKRA